MQGILFAIAAGIMIGLQGIFTSRISEKIGLWETNTLVHAVGLIITLSFLFWRGDGSFAKLDQVNPIYLPGLCFGALIVFCIMQSVLHLGPSWATVLLLISQLVVATAIECRGLCETTPVKFHFTQPLGLALMILGVLVFKLNELLK